MNPIDLESLEKLIETREYWFSASELQGIITAFIAFKQKTIAFELLCLDTTDDFLNKFIDHQQKSLNENDFSYKLLLKEKPLSQRAESLIQWCSGFLLAYNFLKEKQKINIKDAQIQEYLNELQAISELDTNILENEENAQQLMNLEEHCRLGIFLVYEN